MNIGTITCLLLGNACFFYGLLFTVLKDKRAILVSGFNTLPKDQRDTYDKSAISKDMAHQMFTYFFVFFIGALCSHFISPYLAIITFIVWLYLFFKEVHLDPKKALAKYKL